ncbi:MAG: hypothetical protein EKK41_29320 [Hyphomicrobiales bacterium]|nr:MAG: hypothetical protein EKK41_29320 [Hyphomicrobiales bacterium]
MSRTLVAFVLAVSMCGLAAPARGVEDVFTGEIAALLDWSVNNCDFKSSDKAHKLVEAEKAKSEAKFSDSYLKGFSGKLLSEAKQSRNAAEKLCGQIKDWYGTGGSRIAGLVAGPAQTIEPASASPKQADSTGRRGRKRGP